MIFKTKIGQKKNEMDTIIVEFLLSCLHLLNKERNTFVLPKHTLYMPYFNYHLLLLLLLLDLQVPLPVPIIVLLASIYLVIAPIIQNPGMQFVYAVIFILAGLVVYVPFIYKGIHFKFVGE